ncbi:hypothetical protein [Saccharomonospora piscinae]|uniref:hypothetical protein n=1 Tax=Saccharomonospora piscinae TaxID=687388 RepID=UPI002678E14D
MSQVVQTITAQYVRRDEDWAVTVSGLGRTLNGRASGIIAARDRADQFAEQLSPEGAQPTVVHLLNGSAYEFTSTYMTARLTRAEDAETTAAPTADTGAATDEQSPAHDEQADGDETAPPQSAQSAQATPDKTDETDEAPEEAKSAEPAATTAVPRKHLPSRVTPAYAQAG